MNASRAEMIAGVKEHAIRNYDRGWDIVIETMEDDELAEKFGRAQSVEGAIDKLRPTVATRKAQLVETSFAGDPTHAAEREDNTDWVAQLEAANTDEDES
jgi:hypothetical protein